MNKRDAEQGGFSVIETLYCYLQTSFRPQSVARRYSSRSIDDLLSISVLFSACTGSISADDWDEIHTATRFPYQRVILRFRREIVNLI